VMGFAADNCNTALFKFVTFNKLFRCSIDSFVQFWSGVR
jgi:hypothetical protein